MLGVITGLVSKRCVAVEVGLPSFTHNKPGARCRAWSATHTGRFTPAERVPGTQHGSSVGPKGGQATAGMEPRSFDCEAHSPIPTLTEITRHHWESCDRLCAEQPVGRVAGETEVLGENLPQW
jgi:hypothetical protein